MKRFAVLLAAAAVASPASAQRPVPSHAAAVPPVVRDAARVNGVAIGDDRLSAALNALMPRESFHRNVGAAKLAELRQKALQSLIDEELRYQDGQERRLRVSDAEVSSELARVRRGYRTAAAFDEARRRAGVTIADLRHAIRRGLVARRAYDTAVTAKCGLGAGEAERFYADNPSRFVVPEQLHIYAVTIRVDPSSPASRWAEAKATAEDVLRQLRGGAPFDAMVARYSSGQDRASGGDMGFVHRGSLADEFERATRDLHAGDLSEVVQTLYGFHIVRVAEIKPARQKTFAEVGAEIGRDLRERRCASVNDAWMERLRAAAVIEVLDPSLALATPPGAAR